MKNIVFIIESLQLGGAEKSLVTLFQNFDYEKYNVDLITFHSGGFFKDYLPDAVNHIIIEFPKVNFSDRLIYFVRRKIYKTHHAQLFWRIVEKYFYIQDKQYDIAFAYNQGFTTYFTDKFIRANKKYCWINTDYKNAGYNIKLDLPIYKRYNKIIAVSDEGKKSLEQELAKYNERLDIFVVKDITDKDILFRQSVEFGTDNYFSDKISIVTVARLVEAKGLNLAIEACSILKTKYPVEWIVVGEGGERKKLTKLIEAKGLRDDFKLIGAFTNPYPFMKNCDIYVQTSLFEGLGLTVIEASYLNKPIVCTNFPTAYHILRDEETGLIVEMDAKAIANGVERLINDKDLKNKLVLNLEKQNNNDKKVTLQKIEELLNE